MPRPKLLHSPRFWIVGVFVLSRIVYYALGLRFQTEFLFTNFQFIDITLLKTRLWESLYYFHEQPPLQNALLGIIVKAFPVNYGEALHGVMLLAGCASALLLFQIMSYLGVGTRLATTLAILYSISPGVVMFENFPCYEYPMAFFTLAAGVALYRLATRPGFWISFTFFLLLALLAWIRALYHLVFIVALIPVLAWFVRRNRRAVILGAILPCLTILALYVKNREVFGFFGSSSWLGNNLATVTIHQLSPSEREELIQQGRLDPIVRVEAPSLAHDYFPYLKPPAPTGIPVLDQEVKQTGGAVNTNNIIYLQTGQRYTKAAMQVLHYRPQAYLRSFTIAVFCYFLPPTDFFQFEALRRPVRSFDRFLNIAMFGEFRETTRKGLRALKAEGHTASLVLYTGTFLIVLLPVLLLWNLRSIWEGIRHRRLDRTRVALLVFIFSNIVFTAAVTTLLSSFENNRYRFPTDCLYVILLGTLIQHTYTSLRSRKSPA